MVCPTLQYVPWIMYNRIICDTFPLKWSWEKSQTWNVTNRAGCKSQVESENERNFNEILVIFNSLIAYWLG